MTEHLLSPDREITAGPRTFTLSGSFATLKAVQHAFKRDILFVQAGILHMRQDEIAKLLAIGSGSPESEDEIGQFLLDELDIAGPDFQMLKAELLAWLGVAMTPKRDREKKVREMETALQKLSKASRGKSTRSTASAS